MKRSKSCAGFVIAVILLFLIGCASLKQTSDKVSEPFKSKQRINLQPFAEHLVDLVGDMQYGLDVHPPKYIGKFVDTTEVNEFKVKFEYFKRNIGQIIGYSAKVITLVQADMSEPEKINALVDFIENLRPQRKIELEIKFGLSKEEAEEILDKAGNQEKLLDALKIVQPITDEIAEYLIANIDELHTKRNSATNWRSKNPKRRRAKSKIPKKKV